MNWTWSCLFYVLAIIALIIAVILGWKATQKCAEKHRQRDADRAHYFFWASIALGVLGLYGQGWEATL